MILLDCLISGAVSWENGCNFEFILINALDWYCESR